MTTFPIFAVVALSGAVALIAFALSIVRRRNAISIAARNDDAQVTPPSEGDFGVPFTHLGVEIEPPSAPLWLTHASTPLPAQGGEPLALAHVDRATAILHDHVKHESSSIASWVVLLELYRTHGREQALAQLAGDFRERFHAHRDGVDALRGGNDGGLEAFPPVMRLVTMLWGTHEGRDLLERLSRDRAEGRRFGLTRTAYVDIATLAKLQETLLAELDADRAEEAKVRAAWQTAGYVAQLDR